MEKRKLFKIWCENGATYENLTNTIKAFLPRRPILQGGSYKPDENGKRAYYCKYNLSENELSNILANIDKKYLYSIAITELTHVK